MKIPTTPEGRVPGRVASCTGKTAVEQRRGSPALPVASFSPVPPATPGASGALADSEKPPAPPDLAKPQRPWPGLDRLGAIQASGGLILGLIALFTSYDHISIGAYRLPVPQQWGIPLIAASVATIFIDAELAT